MIWPAVRNEGNGGSNVKEEKERVCGGGEMENEKCEVRIGGVGVVD